MTKRLLLIVGLALGLGLARNLVAGPGPEDVRPVTAILVRHAETAASTQTARDPELSEKGQRRAQSLARLLGAAGVTHLWSTDFLRTRATLAPLAAALDLDVTIVADPGATAGLAEELRGLPPGSVALVAGHSNTVPALVAALGGSIRDLEEHPRHGPVLGHDQYDRLFVVTFAAAAGVATETLELRYGD